MLHWHHPAKWRSGQRGALIELSRLVAIEKDASWQRSAQARRATIGWEEHKERSAASCVRQRSLDSCACSTPHVSAETRDRAGDFQIFSLTLSQLSYRGFVHLRRMQHEGAMRKPSVRLLDWLRGVTVSTLDSESSDRGSNPREAFIELIRATGPYAKVTRTHTQPHVP